MSDERIQQLSFIEQNLTNIVGQKQQFQRQSLEIDSALAELKNSSEGYQIVGSVMVKKSSEDIIKNLEEKKKIRGKEGLL